jgi:DNA-binding MarR family transcriptional regulator
MDHVDREAPPDANPRVSYAIAQLQALVLASVNEVAGRHNLTALQFTTLSVLNHHGAPLSNSQLARRSFMTAQSMHEVINRLEEAGLIKRNPHPNHRRKLPASLTPKGRRVLAACESGVAEFEARMLVGFSRAERTKFLAMIKSAVRNLRGGSADGAQRASDPTASTPPSGRRGPRERAA